MKRFILALLLCCASAVAQAADAIVLSTDASQTLYVRIYPTSSTAVHNTLTAGTSNAVRRYAVTDAALVTAGLAASTSGVTVAYAYDVFYGTSSASADDVLWGSGTLFWKDGAAQGGPDTGVTLSAGDIDDIVDALVLAGAVATPVSADIIADTRTWIADGYRARNIIEVEDSFVGTFAYKPNLNTATTINTVSAVAITGAATVTATDLSVDRSRTKAMFTVPSLTTAGDYTVRVTVTTVDGQTIVSTGTLRVH